LARDTHTKKSGTTNQPRVENKLNKVAVNCFVGLFLGGETKEIDIEL
jgi:hypothetical protein